MEVKSNRNMQYVCFFPDQDFWKPVASDLSNYQNVVINKQLQGNLKKLIHRIHYSMRINTRVNLLFKKIWYRSYLDCDSLCYDDNIVFIFIEGTNISYDYRYLDLLKKKYINAKFAYYFVNTVPLQTKYCVPNLNDIKKHYDLLVAFDLDDAEKYGMLYYSGMYAKMPITRQIKKGSDLLFIGRNKGRIDLLHAIYKKLKEEGLICDFHIMDVPKEKQIYPEEILYNKYVPYDEVVERINNTKCIMELIWNERSNCTLRSREAIVFGKKLITNNQNITKMRFYNEKYIKVIQTELDIDKIFIEEPVEFDYKVFENELLPIHFLEFLSENLFCEMK